MPITIDGLEFDQLAIRFAQYHMQLMIPARDKRMNIGAKGLSGEGYKGHTFWDTEIFLLPYFIFNMPEVARSLEEYRYLSLPGAHAKAKHSGCEGGRSSPGSPPGWTTARCPLSIWAPTLLPAS